MRIAFSTIEFVTESNYDGGLANYLFRSALSLQQLGHQPIVFVSAEKEDEILFHGIKVVRVPIQFIRLRKWVEKRNLQKFANTIFFLNQSWNHNRYIKKEHQKTPIDIIQYTHLGGIGLFRPNNIPAVIRMSSYTPLVNLAYEKKAGWQQNFWEQLAIRRSDGVFSPSRIIADIESRIINKEVRVIESPYIHEPIEYDYSIYKKYISNKKYLLFFGTLGLLKGIDTIGKILFPLFTKYPDLFFVFVGKDVGLREQTSVDYLRQCANPFTEKIICLGKLPHSSLYPIIDKAELVVLPSRVDNFPNTCIEAMAFRKIVIGTYGTSFEQLIEDGKSGFLCKIDDPDQLLSCVKLALNLNATEKEKIQNQAWIRIMKLHPDIVGRELISFYEQIITQFNQKRSIRGK